MDTLLLIAQILHTMIKMSSIEKLYFGYYVNAFVILILSVFQVVRINFCLVENSSSASSYFFFFIFCFCSFFSDSSVW